MMKKINLKGISEILSEKELKNVMGGSGGCSGRDTVCSGASCTKGNGSSGKCTKHSSERNCACR